MKPSHISSRMVSFLLAIFYTSDEDQNAFFFPFCSLMTCFRGLFQHLPLDFWKTYLNRINGNVVLYGSDWGAWTVNFTTKKYQADRQASFVNGWKKFVQDNDLVVGDICSFELINRGKAETSFKVTISRSAGGSNS